MSIQNEDQSTLLQKAVVCGTSFCTSCAFFMLGAVVLLPLTASVLEFLAVPELVTQAVVMLLVFGTPIVGALIGLRIGLRATGLLPAFAPAPAD